MPLPLVFLVRMLWLNLHPIYGGRFGLRGVFLLKSLFASESLKIRKFFASQQRQPVMGFYKADWKKQAFWNAEMPNTMEKCSDP